MNCPELELGHMCHDGLDVERDYAKAMQWYLKATRSSGNFPDGHPDSYYCVGNMYHKGEGVEKNNARAAKFFRKSALLGMADAQVATAYMLYFGIGCRENQKEALAWLEKAAAQGCIDGQYLLADSLADNDPAKSYYWFVCAVNNADLDDEHREKAMAAMREIKGRISFEDAKEIEQLARARWGN